MHYWNRSNFDGLKEVGESYSQRAGYDDFARYCLLREQGLKKAALSAVAAFIRRAEQLPVARQRELVEEFCQLRLSRPEVHQLLPQPLIVFLQRVLEQWRVDQPALATPFRWSGLLCGDVSFYEEAVKRAPDDDFSLGRLAQVSLDAVGYQTHHLCESSFIGSEEDAFAALGKAAAYILRMPATEARQVLQQQISYYRGLLEAWQRYKSEGAVTGFPDWCRQQDMDFAFSSVIYYDA